MRERPPAMQAFIAIPGVVAVVDSVVAGAIAGVAALGLDLGTATSIALGGVFFLLSVGFFAMWAERVTDSFTAQLHPIFPSPPPVDAD